MCVHERALHGRIVCVRAVCLFSHVDVSYACVFVVCVRSRACVALPPRVRTRRVNVVTSMLAHRRLVCVRVVCMLSRECVRADVSGACRLFVTGERALWTFWSISGRGWLSPTRNPDIVWPFACLTSVSNYATSVFGGV